MVANVTHDNGKTPVIYGNPKRTELVLQNNSDVTIHVRWRGHVSMTDANFAGIQLRASGGTLILTGDAASQSIHAVHGTGVDLIKQLTFETDVLPN